MDIERLWWRVLPLWRAEHLEESHRFGEVYADRRLGVCDMALVGRYHMEGTVIERL